MVGLYQEKGLKSLSEMFIKEEPDNEQFKKELDDAQAKSEGKKKNPDIAKGSVQAVQKEEVEQIDEDQYDDMLDAMLKGKSGKRLLAKHSAEVQKHKDIESGKALKQHVKKNPGVLKT